MYLIFQVNVLYIILFKQGKESFNNIPDWISFIKNIRVESAVLILVGNKTDLTRQVDKDAVIKLAKQESLFYFEVSALKNEGIQKTIFSSIAELPAFADESDKNKIISELEEGNKAQVNVSVISGVDITPSKDEKQDNKSKEVKEKKEDNIKLKKNKDAKDKKNCCGGSKSDN